MQLLKDRIRRDGKIRSGNVLKVDSFLNHQMDIELFGEIGKEFKKRFADSEVTKILTIEASGIGIACIAAQYFKVPVVFAKKNQTKNIAGDVYTSQVESFTHGRIYDIIVSKDFLKPEDKVLIIDDFLANGAALLGLSKLVKDAGATLVGAGIVIEKGFQEGGSLIRSNGVRVESLAIIDSMSEDNVIVFREEENA
ncbi:MAG TPA: xanthine phosphoribosyltransferase [Clostridiales bacterium]|nr:xanthine phosphoribosyltransferase [Clostridiales bacterium]